MAEEKDKKKNKNIMPKSPNPNTQMWVLIGLSILVFGIMFLSNSNISKKISIYDFEEMALANDVENLVVIKNKDIVEVYLKDEALENSKYAEDVDKKSPFAMKKGPQYHFTIGSVENFEKYLSELNTKLKDENQITSDYIVRNDMSDWIGNFGFLFILLFVFWFLMRRMTGGAGGSGQLFNIGKSKAALFDAENKVKVSFKDVAGLDEAKEEVNEVVDFLKNPDKYTKLGGKIPKGVLLVGPPGTGKTLLAKAVAGEAEVPFFTLSGSDFVEMFVGVGAARVRDLFKQAKSKAPCIIFIDEIDAIGRSRGKGPMQGGNDERENTLNSLLVEMDGFGTDTGVILLAATNRPDVLDSALLRPGRFDRQIYVDMPDLLGREEIFKVHTKPLKLEESIDIEFLARQTPGFSGADIANICNEAALIAARKKKNAITKQDFLDAVDRIIGGLEKKNKLISQKEKEVIAYHEAGHATISWMTEHANPLVKVTIVPRGRSLGAAWYLPNERQITTAEQMLDEMCSALGGRAAEQVIFGKISTGALSDLEKVTKQAYAMVSVYGLNEKIGNISYYDSSGQSEYSMTKPYSEKTAELIDTEVSNMIESSYQRALNILSENKDKLSELANLLLEKEVIFKDDLEKIFGKRPFDEEVNSDEMSKKKENTLKEEVKEIIKNDAPEPNNATVTNGQLFTNEDEKEEDKESSSNTDIEEKQS